MISAVAFCPQPPLLVPALAFGAAGGLAALRTACGTAIAALAAPGRQLVVLGAGESTRSHSPLARGSLTSYGAPLVVNLGAPGCAGAVELPLSLTVGAWLVQQTLGPNSGAVGFSVGRGTEHRPTTAELRALADTDDVALLVMGDGAARRSPTAPGYFDPRAAPFDDTVLAALAAGDAAALVALDPLLGQAVLAAGIPAWRAAGRLLRGRSYQAEVLYADDPYGVGYFVAGWRAHG